VLPFLAQWIQLHPQFLLVLPELLLLQMGLIPKFLSLLAQLTLLATEVVTKLPHGCASILGGKFHLRSQFSDILLQLA
jgi:hypothetical protein